MEITSLRRLTGRYDCESLDPGWSGTAENASLDDMLACLRMVDSNQLVRDMDFLSGSIFGPCFCDDNVLPASFESMSETRSHLLPGKKLLFGTVADEGSYFVKKIAGQSSNLTAFLSVWLKLSGIKEAESILRWYRVSRLLSF